MKENKKNTCFIIPAHNNYSVLFSCIDSILSQRNNDCNILVVDNHSTDNSLVYLDSNYPSVTVVSLDKNYGFAKAINIGIKRALEQEYSFLAFVNSDVILKDDWLDNLISFMKKHDYGCAQSLVLQSGTLSRVDSAGIGISATYAVYDRKRDALLGESLKDQQIFGPCFAAALFERETIISLTETGLFLDESYNSFYEDVDCSFRLNCQGLKAGLLARPLCEHIRSHTADRYSFRKYFLIGRNYPLFLAKHIPFKNLLKKSFPLIAARFGFLLRRILHPTYFFGFLGGTLWGCMLLFSHYLFMRSVSDTALHKQEVLRKIGADFYA